MNKSNLFKAAHKRARALNSNFGSYAKRLSIGLKVEYRNAKILKEALAKQEADNDNNKRLELVRLERFEARKNDQPTSCYFGAFSWEKALS